MGYRFRLHCAKLPGKPDVVLPRHRKVILVHGCFWHQHRGCKLASRPSSNTEYWLAKLDSNVRRDRQNRRKLRALGWKVLVVWECQTRNLPVIEHLLLDFMAAA
jgi:DNA mismatch endonuclease (patch repair protein)